VSDHDDSKIKVTDKRMFAPDGSLREEYRFLEEETKEPKEPPAGPKPPDVAPSEPAERPSRAEGPAAGVITGPGGDPVRGSAPDSAPDSAPGPAPDETEEPELPGDGRHPEFYDLVMALAEPASVYMRNAVQSPAEASQFLEVARLYIDLLDVLRHKCAGNLTAQESDMLEDALHQLRLGYAQIKS